VCFVVWYASLLSATEQRSENLLTNPNFSSIYFELFFDFLLKDQIHQKLQKYPAPIHIL
jgi:hypothetical protein